MPLLLGNTASAGRTTLGIAASTLKFYSSFNGGLRSANYTVYFSDDAITWTTAWSGVASNSSSCGLITASGGGSNYGTHRYWKFVEGSAVVGHFPRVSRITLSTSTGTDYDMVVYTADNCGDQGVYTPGTIIFDSALAAGPSFNFDATIGASYPGSGTSWLDITTNKTISLNSTSYTSNNGGGLSFNGSSSYGTSNISTLGGSYTVEVVLKFVGWNIQGSDPLALTSGSGDAHGFLMEANYESGSDTTGSCTMRYLHRFPYGSGANSDDFNSATALNLNQTYVLTYTRSQGSISKIFINGVQSSSITPIYGAFDADLTRLTVGRLTQTGSARYFNGNLYQIRAYNRALSSTEIASNFDATKTRLGF